MVKITQGDVTANTIKAKWRSKTIQSKDNLFADVRTYFIGFSMVRLSDHPSICHSSTRTHYYPAGPQNKSCGAHHVRSLLFLVPVSVGNLPSKPVASQTKPFSNFNAQKDHYSYFQQI